jgi:uncharacterized protein (DUF1800 family)
MQAINDTQFTRRDALKLGAVLATGLALGGGAAPALADDEAPAPLAQPGVEAQVALPSLGIIALNRLAFGQKPGDMAAWNSLGPDDDTRLTTLVDQQLNPAAIADTDCDNRLAAAAANLPSLNQSLPTLWANYYTASNADRTRPARDVRVATLLRAVYSRRQLLEVMVDFWHNHFSIYAWDSAYAGATWAHYDRDVIRANALGNFYNMLVAVAQSPAMLYYLDNYINQDSGPNENWARELLELHTLGADHYAGIVDPATIPPWSGVPPVPGLPQGFADDDVYQAASCFTGWRVNNGATGTAANNGTFQYYDQWHWQAPKDVMGLHLQYGLGIQDGYAVLRMLADHPGTARYVCTKLCRRLVGDNVPTSLVDTAATQFYNLRNDANQIREVVRTILLSAEFRNTWGQKIKRPHECLYAALRAVQANIAVDSGGLSTLWSNFDQMGQQMFGRRSPDGYPDVRDAWTNTTSILYRWRVINSLMEGSLTGVTANVNAINMGGANTPNTIADFWIDRILGRPMDDGAHRAQIVKMMQGWTTPTPAVTPVYAPDQAMAATDITNRLRRMVAVLLMSPEMQWR